MTQKTSSEPLGFFDHLQDVKKFIDSKEIFIFLDYDGTLTPIVATPDLAVLSDDMRQILQTLSTQYKVSVVSGRATDDVRSKVKLEGIFYAGSHGFEIVDPDNDVEIHQEAHEFRNNIVKIHQRLEERLKDVEGALVEDVKFTISTHYRLVSEGDFPKVKAAVEDVLKEFSNVRLTHGKKVFEIRPNIDWDKGKAVDWILDVLKYDPEKNVAIYIGDDTTDEDAFAALEHKGFGILVAEQVRESKAKYWIENTDEVKKVLQMFIDLKE